MSAKQSSSLSGYGDDDSTWACDAPLAQPARGQRWQDHRAEVVRLRTTAALAQAMLKQTAALNRSDCYYCPVAASDAGRVHRLAGRAQKKRLSLPGIDSRNGVRRVCYFAAACAQVHQACSAASLSMWLSVYKFVTGY